MKLKPMLLSTGVLCPDRDMYGFGVTSHGVLGQSFVLPLDERRD